MSTKLRREEKKGVIALSIIIAVALAGVVIGVRDIIAGSLFAVIYSTFCLFIAALAGEQIENIYGEAKRRDGNA
jgi:uncharacterized membrane protein YhaH (DUF805 family)